MPNSPPPHNARTHAYHRTQEYLFAQLIPYIGSKRKLLPVIHEALQSTGEENGTFADFFAGSGVVSRFAKMLGYRVIANDWEPYAEVLNGAFVGLNSPPCGPQRFDILNSLPPLDGHVTKHYCPADDDAPDPATERLFFTRANGRRIDAIRSKICEWEADGEIDRDEKNYLLAPLLSAASFVANTSGVFKAYHNGWGGKTGTAHYRILSDLRIAPPPLCDNGQQNCVLRTDALTLATAFKTMAGCECDIAYLDPPYNQHPYGSNYHLLNTITLWDSPVVPALAEAKSAIRTDWRTERRSEYNTASRALPALTSLLDELRARWVLMSYSTDGNIPLRPLLGAFAERGALSVTARRYKRYRVSTPRMPALSHNVEFVLVLDRQARPRMSAVEECRAAIEAAKL